MPPFCARRRETVMSTGQTDYKAFRQRLDAVLRQTNPVVLRDFLIAEGQWQQDASNDAEAAMWMMIAASTALADLHDEARHWLLGNGHEAEANAIFGRRSGGGAPRGTARSMKGKPQGSAPNSGQRGQQGSRDRQQPANNLPKQPKRDPRVH